MGELRLYAVGVDEVRGMFGASPPIAEHLREVARRAFAPPAVEARGGLLSKLGPIFKRVPATPVISPTQPEPHDVEVLLSGAYVSPDRTGATWRLLETLVQGIAWGSTRMSLTAQSLDDLDFALARGGVGGVAAPAEQHDEPQSGSGAGADGWVAPVSQGAGDGGRIPISNPGHQDRGAAGDDQLADRLAGGLRALGAGGRLSGSAGS